ncbi:MAG: HAD family phosphatase [Leptolyngbyaceae cyanobacterium RU_5_1]|nr:HAD family phosphatase [Leptolyngbyaceae cyanobacterium RU_5_1]
MQQATVTSQTTQPFNLARPNDIQLLVLDIDGTIAGASNNIREPVKQAVRAAQATGVQVAIATGRMYRSALRFHHDIGATLPLMAYQGALIKDPATQTIHRHWTVPKHLALRLLDHFEQPELYSLLSIHFYMDDQLYVRELTPASRDYGERTGVEPIPIGDLRKSLTTEPTKVLALSDDADLIYRLLNTLRDRHPPAELYLTTSVATFFEATHPLVNKGTAVRYLAEEHLGIQAANVMVIGDNFNDLEMIEYAGIGVAMGNAPEGVKKSANWIAPSVEADGAAAAIAEFLL